MIWFFGVLLVVFSMARWLAAKRRYSKALRALILNELSARAGARLSDVTGLDLSVILTSRIGIPIEPHDLYNLLRDLADEGHLVRTEVPDWNPSRPDGIRAVYRVAGPGR